MEFKDYLRQIFAEDGGSDGNDDKGGNPGADDKGGNNGKDTKKYSDADVDEIINKKFAKWQKEQERKISEAEKLAGMNAQEKAEHERDTLQKELDELKRANSIAEMEKTARTMLHDDGVNVPDEVVSSLIADDADNTKAKVEAFSKAFKEAVQKAVKDALKGKAPATGKGGSTLTKADILKITNRAERQKAIAEHIDLFQ
ncbi:DUF4355 domain-containing protein [Catenibacterium mitsuokai]|uniref:DUF4355 domain-containing protein n=1 Tax=Catenibacterium mitsuokai TaxID=100886 RepID=UPI0018A9409F|nr:DUF4355 domain-containing protein [Catenibacterium mitsuokai]